jgi:putative peptidoglycan lipid II flippase
MIVTLLWWGATVPLPRLAVLLAWGAVAGSALQMLVQMPAVLRLVPDLRLRLELSEHVRTTVNNFAPVLVSRGVVQISAYIDALLASLLPTGAVTGLANAQLLYTLPASVFGLSVAAAALPAMAGAAGLDALDTVRDRINSGLRQIAFFVVPSAVAFLVLGDVVAAAMFQTGRFTHDDAIYVWGILAGFSLGLLATTCARLYSSSYYALRDTARRSARSCTWQSPPCSAISRRSCCPGRSASTGSGEPPASQPPQAWQDGSNCCCCDGR